MSATQPPGEPVGAGERDRLLAPFARFKRIALAVSGGADSLALMHLTACWAGARGVDPACGSGCHIEVVTVDHGLRAEADMEAAWVGAEAAKLGLPHTVLRWTKAWPATGLQAAARDARYQLLLRFAVARGIDAIATGHQAEDQAETLIMRLARGSGVDGLAGMPGAAVLAPPHASRTAGATVTLLRPLLQVSKDRLAATLRAEGLSWLDDPSNQNLKFERVRLRQAAPVLSGLGLEPGRLALSAHRLQRARAALEQATGALAARAVDLHDGLYCSIDRAALDAAPAEIALRLLGRVLSAYGGQTGPPRLAKLESLQAQLIGSRPHRATLAGCLIRADGARVHVYREPGRAGLPVIMLGPGQSAPWDRRFLVGLCANARGPVVVRALAMDDLAILRHSKNPGMKLALPNKVLLSQPGFWHQERLVAIPCLDRGVDLRAAAREWEAERHYSAVFTNAAVIMTSPGAG